MVLSTKTLVYAPQVQAYVAHTDEKGKITVYDLSKDIVSGSVNRQVNAVSSASLVIANRGNRYDRKLSRMDRIHIRAVKGGQTYPLFTGYLTQVPVFELFKRTFTIKAQDTLKQILHTYWDKDDADNVERYIVKRQPIKQTKVEVNLSAVNAATGGADTTGSVQVVGPESVQQLVKFAMSYLGKFRYSQASGRNSPLTSGYTDCSGFVSWCYRQVLNITLGVGGDNSTRGMWRDHGVIVQEGSGAPDESKMQAGDTVLFVWQGGSQVAHVEMYCGSGQLIGQPGGMGPRMTSLAGLCRSAASWRVKRYVATTGGAATGGTAVNYGGREDSANTDTGSTVTEEEMFDARTGYFTQQAADGLNGIRLKGFLNEVCGWPYGRLLIEAVPDKIAAVIASLGLQEGAGDPDEMLQEVYNAIMGDTFSTTKTESEQATISNSNWTGNEGGNDRQYARLMYGVAMAVSRLNYKCLPNDLMYKWASGGSGAYGFKTPNMNATKAQQDAAAKARFARARGGDVDGVDDKKLLKAFFLGTTIDGDTSKGTGRTVSGKGGSATIAELVNMAYNYSKKAPGAASSTDFPGNSSTPGTGTTNWGNVGLTGAAVGAATTRAATSSGGGSSTVLANFLKGLRETESNGNYQVRTSMANSDASGAYQYISSTWNNYGGYSAAYLAPAAVQDKRAGEDAVAAFNKYGDWRKVAANHIYPAWASNMGLWGSKVPNNPITMWQYVNKVCKYIDSTQYTTAPDGAAVAATGDTTGGGSTDISAALVDAIDTGLYSFFKQVGFNNPYAGSGTAAALTGEKALLNDVSAMDFVKTLCTGSMRDFQSDPYGNFMAYFPDYYGQWKDSAWSNIIDVQDVELKDFSIAATDNIYTHVYVLDNAAYPDLYGMGGDSSLSTFLRQQQATGVVTMENEDLMADLLGVTPDECRKFLKTFGGRPKVEDRPEITNRTFANLYALSLFQRRWSEQWQTAVDFTFMPELWPGCRARIGDTGCGVYINSVTHNFSYQSGFTTSANVSCLQALSPNCVVPNLPKGYKI